MQANHSVARPEAVTLSDAEAALVARIRMLPQTESTLEIYAIGEIFRHSDFVRADAARLLVDFTAFNARAAANVARLTADLMDCATDNTHPAHAALGGHASQIAGQVLRAISVDELGTAQNEYRDPHDCLMRFTLKTLATFVGADVLPSDSAKAAAAQTTALYRGARVPLDFSPEQILAFRIGCHLASEYSASEEFGEMTAFLETHHTKLFRRLSQTQSEEWTGVSALTWLDCHREVEIEHASHAVHAAETLTGNFPHLESAFGAGFQEFYATRLTFFQSLPAK